MSEPELPGIQMFARWVRATFVGWILGIPLIIVAALLGELFGVGGMQFLVGAGMGAGVGLMQGRAMRNVLLKFGSWFWSCVLGLSAPFVIADIGSALGVGIPYMVYFAVATGGLIVGIWQAYLLRRHFDRTVWWVVGSLLGWSLASGTGALAGVLTQSQSMRGIGGALAYLGIVASGGVVLGVVTGIVLVWGLRKNSVVS